MSNSEFVRTVLGAGAFMLAVSLAYMVLIRVDKRLRAHPWFGLLQSLLLVVAACGVGAIAIGILAFLFLH
jgi:hypothetical protein